MKIPSELRKQWEQLYERGDYDTIADQSNLNINTIRGAFSTNRATERVISAIQKFYLERKKKNDQRISELKNSAA